MAVRAQIFRKQANDCKVTPEHLSDLASVHEVLYELNDPYAGTPRLAALIQNVPVLAARCRKAAALRRPQAEITSVERALNIIGSRGLEVTLLDLLEDLTMLKAELEEGS